MENCKLRIRGDLISRCFKIGCSTILIIKRTHTNIVDQSKNVRLRCARLPVVV